MSGPHAWKDGGIIPDDADRRHQYISGSIDFLGIGVGVGTGFFDTYATDQTEVAVFYLIRAVRHKQVFIFGLRPQSTVDRFARRQCILEFGSVDFRTVVASTFIKIQKITHNRAHQRRSRDCRAGV